MIYREMTPEEKLEYNQEMLEALIKNSFMGANIVHEKWKLKLSRNGKLDDTMEKTFGTEALQMHEKAMHEDEKKEVISYPHIEQLGTKPKTSLDQKRASIYAAKNLPLVEEDLNGPRIPNENQVLEQPKTRVLEQVTQQFHNPWVEAKTVMPGEVQELLRR